jgi:hypothetical protein
VSSQGRENEYDPFVRLADHCAATQAHLRKTVLNLVRDEARRLAGRTPLCEVIESPTDRLIQQQTFLHYRRALVSLRPPRDRVLIAASIERDWGVEEIAARLHTKSVPATRVAIARTMERLSKRPALPAALTPSPSPSS